LVVNVVSLSAIKLRLQAKNMFAAMTNQLPGAPRRGRGPPFDARGKFAGISVTDPLAM
jgi:hypothetical protein